MSHIYSAFDGLVPDAKVPEPWYVCLMEKSYTYGGPEEGGWYRNSTILVKYKECTSEEQANSLKERVEQLAEELNQQARKTHGEYCLRTMEWLYSRGLDADFLPEPDGPNEYYVLVSQGIPENSYGPTRYE